MTQPQIPDEQIEKIDSVPGLRTALEVLGAANKKAHDEGRCVMDFYLTDEGRMTIAEITEHVETLEDGADAGSD